MLALIMHSSRDDMSKCRKPTLTSVGRTNRKSSLSVGWMRPIRLSETILATTPAGNAPLEFTRFPGDFGCCSYPSFVMILYLMGQYSNGSICKENLRHGLTSIMGLVSIGQFELF